MKIKLLGPSTRQGALARQGRKIEQGLRTKHFSENLHRFRFHGRGLSRSAKSKKIIDPANNSREWSPIAPTLVSLVLGLQDFPEPIAFRI